MSDTSDAATRATPSEGAGASPAPPPASRDEPDWTEQVTDLIVDTVGKVRDRTTGPVLDISHGSVHGLVALLVLAPVSVIFVIFLIRFLNWAIPGDVWLIYAGLGIIFSAIGVVLWSRRESSTP